MVERQRDAAKGLKKDSFLFAFLKDALLLFLFDFWFWLLRLLFPLSELAWSEQRLAPLDLGG